MKTSILILLLSICSLSHAGNLGHRMAGGEEEYFSTLPENSLSSLKALLTKRTGFLNLRPPIQYRKDFIYLEFDVQETYDGYLVAFHDDNFKRLLPRSVNSKEAKRLENCPILKNRLLNDVRQTITKDKDIISGTPEAIYLTVGGKVKIRYENLRVQDLTLRELKRLNLMKKVNGKVVNSKEKVATLSEMRTMLKRYKLRKPIAIEVKYLRSQNGRDKLINWARSVRPLLKDIKYVKAYNFPFRKVGIFGFDKSVKLSFPEEDLFDDFCEKLKQYRFKNYYGPGKDHRNGKCDHSNFGFIFR